MKFLSKKNFYSRSLVTSIFFCMSFFSNAVICASNIEKDELSLKGLVINVIGDSYVANHKCPKSESWHSKFAAKYGMVYNNYGRNGGCVAFDRSKDGFGPSLMVRYKMMADNADVILIIAGHNDATKIGLSRDSLKMFSDSLDVLLTSIKIKSPNAKIGYVTPWYVDRNGFKETVKVIKKVCRKHGVPVLDNYSKKCIIKVRDENFRTKYFQGKNDTAHLNDSGHDLFLPIGESFIKKLIGKQ